MGGKDDGTKTAFNMFSFSIDKSSNFSAGIKWLIRLGKIDGNTESYQVARFVRDFHGLLRSQC